VLSTAWFSLGFTLAFVALGVGAAAVSAELEAWKPALLITGAVIMGVFGLRMMRMISFSWLERSFQLPDFSNRVPRGLSGLVFGLIFGLGWTPCVGPILGAVLTYVASQQSSPSKGALMLFVFAQGIALPLIFVSAALEHARPLLAKLRSWLPRIEYAMGLGLFIFAMLMVNAARFSAPNVSGASSSITALDQHDKVVHLGQKGAGHVRMVFFHSENCPICHAMEAYLPQFEKDCTSAAFEFSKVDVDLPQNGAAAARYNVRAVPTISVLSADGDELIHLVGYQTEGRLREAAKSAAGLLCSNAGFSSDRPGFIEPKPPASEYEENQVCTVGKSC
jgi:cytochrome c-type biogenesis protein